MFSLLDHFEICEIYVFVDISVSPFIFANMSSKYIANLAASNVTLTRHENTVQSPSIQMWRKLLRLLHWYN